MRQLYVNQKNDTGTGETVPVEHDAQKFRASPPGFESPPDFVLNTCKCLVLKFGGYGVAAAAEGAQIGTGSRIVPIGACHIKAQLRT
jgi:hypothetical protein